MTNRESELANYYFKPVSMWENIPENIYRKFKANSTIFKIPKNNDIYSEGAYPRGLYVINKGIAKLYILNNEGKEQIVYMLGENEMFGYRPILCNDNSPVFISALEDCEIEMIDKEVFLSCIHSSFELSTLFLHYFGNEFRILTNKISVYALKPADERLALTLLILNRKFNSVQGNILHFNRLDIANFAGITRETLSRQLKKLKDRNVINVRGWDIELINFDALYDMANI